MTTTMRKAIEKVAMAWLRNILYGHGMSPIDVRVGRGNEEAVIQRLPLLRRAGVLSGVRMVTSSLTRPGVVWLHPARQPSIINPKNLNRGMAVKANRRGASKAYRSFWE